jgi:hypothetical protein
MAACTGDAPGDFTEELVGGVLVRTYHADSPPHGDLYDVSESTRFGADQSGDTYLLASAGVLNRTPLGTLLVADYDDGRIHRFAPYGEHLDSFGGRGQGPGELMMSVMALTAGDSIMVPDVGNRRLSIYREDGSFLSQRVFPGSLQARSLRMATLPGAGFAATRYDAEAQAGTASAFVFRWDFEAFTLAPDLEPVATLVDTAYETEWPIIGNMYLSPPLRYDDHLRHALGPEGRLAWVDSEAYRIDFLDFATGFRRAVVLPMDSRRVTSAVREAYYAEHVAEDYPLEGLRRLSLPSHLPAIERLIWDSGGRLWVQDYSLFGPEGEEHDFTFNVFDPVGDWLFGQTLPAYPDLIMGDGFYTNTTDESGNPIVQFYRFDRRD